MRRYLRTSEHSSLALSDVFRGQGENQCVCLVATSLIEAVERELWVALLDLVEDLTLGKRSIAEDDLTGARGSCFDDDAAGSLASKSADALIHGYDSGRLGIAFDAEELDAG